HGADELGRERPGARHAGRPVEHHRTGDVWLDAAGRSDDPGAPALSVSPIRPLHRCDGKQRGGTGAAEQPKQLRLHDAVGHEPGRASASKSRGPLAWRPGWPLHSLSMTASAASNSRPRTTATPRGATHAADDGASSTKPRESGLPGRLDHGRMQKLLGYSLAQAAIPGLRIFNKHIGEPFQLRRL